MKLIYKKLFEKQPDDKTGVLCMATNCDIDGTLMKYRTLIGRSDTFEESLISFSTDGGKSFSKPIADKTRWENPEGTMTRYFKTSLLDSDTNRFYMFYNVGLLPSDKPLEGLQSWNIHYAMKEDCKKPIVFEKPVVMTNHDLENPVKGVYKGKNSFMIGDWPCEPKITSDRHILLPFQTSMFDEKGAVYNPGGGYTYHYSRILHGRFLENGEIQWFDVSEDVITSPKQSTRGMLEPTIALVPHSRVLMVMRASNGGEFDPNHEIPGRRWFCVSNDGGFNFTKPEPWTYEDGTPFYSPSSCSGIIRHQNGKHYWIGNICDENPRANMPRNPLCICEINPETLLLKKDTKFIIDERKQEQYVDTTFSNFYVREEQSTGDILVYCTAMWQSLENIFLNSDSYEYRLKP